MRAPSSRSVAAVTLLAVAAAVVLWPARVAALETLIPNDQNFQSHHATHLPVPAGPTEVLRLHDMAVGSCAIWGTGVDVATFRCGVDGTDFLSPTTGLLAAGHAATSVVGRAAGTSGAAADISCPTPGTFLGNVGGTLSCAAAAGVFTPDAPLVFGGTGGSHLQLTLDGTSIGSSAGALRLLAGTGAVTWAAGSTATSFGTQTGLSLFGVAGSSTAVPAPIVASGAVPEIPIYNGSTSIAWSPLVATALPGATVYADGIATGTVQLASLAAASLTAGTVAYVATVGDYFALKLSALTTTATTVVTASGKSGYQWVRMGVANQRWLTSTTWFIDGANASTAASDENDCQSGGSPCLTQSEVARRVAHAFYTSSPTFTYLSSCGGSDSASFDINSAADVNPLFIGTLASLYAGTITSYTAQGTPPGTTDTELHDTGIPVSFTASGLMADGVLFKRTSSTPAYWWAAKDLGSKTIRISVPWNSSIPTAPITIANGDSYSAFSLPTNPGIRFTAPNLNIRVEFLNLTANFSSQHSVQAVSFLTCAFTGQASVKIDNGFHVGSGFFGTGAGTAFFAGQTTQQSTTNGGLFKSFGSSVVAYQLTMTMSSPTFQATGLNASNGRAIIVAPGISIYDTSLDALTASDNGSIYMERTAALNASGLTGNLLVAIGGSLIQYENAPPVSVSSTSHSNPVSLDGASHPVTDLPLMLTSTGGGIYLVRTSGVPYLQDPGSNGIAVRSALGTSTSRSLTNTDGTVTITNPDGIAGNPVINTTGLTPATRTVQGTAPVAIAGDHAAHDLSANRTWSLDANGVTDSLFRQSGPLALVGRSANSTGNTGDISASASSGCVYRESSSTLGCGSITEGIVLNLSSDLAAKALGTRSLIAGLGLTGGGDLTADRTFDVGANADGSIVVNANDIQVGVLATDAQHGARGGGTQHAVATTSVAGFESAADKAKLDGIAAGATVGTVYTGTSPIVVSGSAISCPTCGTGTGSGSVTTVTGTAPIVITSTPTTTPNVTIATDATLAVVSSNLGRAAVSGDGSIPAGTNVFALNNIPSGTTAAGFVDFAQIGPPATPVSGHGRIYEDNVSANFAYKNAAATVSHMVQTISPIGSQFLTGINDAGISSRAQPVESDIVNLVSDLAGKQGVLTFPSAGQVFVSAGTASNPVGDSNFTFDTATHTLTSNHATVLNGSVQLPSAAAGVEVLLGIGSTGFVEDVFTGTGLSLSGGALSLAPSGVSAATYGSTGNFIRSITVDATGRITANPTVATGPQTMSLGFFCPGASMGFNSTSVVAMANGTAVNYSASAGTGPEVVMSNNAFTANMAPSYLIPFVNGSGTFNAFVENATGSGSGTGSIEIEMWEVTGNPTSSANYRRIANCSISVSTGFSGGQCSSTISALSSAGDAVIVDAWRTDLNNLLSLSSVVISATATLSQ